MIETKILKPNVNTNENLSGDNMSFTRKNGHQVKENVK